MALVIAALALTWLSIAARSASALGQPGYVYDAPPALSVANTAWSNTPTTPASALSPDSVSPGAVLGAWKGRAFDIRKVACRRRATELTRVGRWMDQSEYDQMVESGRGQEGEAGRTYVVKPAELGGYTGRRLGRSSRASNVRSDSLIQGGRSNWFFIKGPNVETPIFGEPLLDSGWPRPPPTREQCCGPDYPNPTLLFDVRVGSRARASSETPVPTGASPPL